MEDNAESTRKEVQEKLRACTEISEYFCLLNEYKSDLIIVVCTKDNIGRSISGQVFERWAELGFKTDLTCQGSNEKAYRGYIAIMESGRIIVEKMGYTTEIDISYEDLTFTIKSTVWQPQKGCGNISILYNQLEYAVNHRGWNFLIINYHTKEVVDTVAFDTHVVNGECVRIDCNLLPLDSEEKKYCDLVNRLKKRLRLGEENRVGIITYGGLGDSYALLSSVLHAEQVLGKRFVFIYASETHAEVVEWFNNYNIESLCISSNEWILCKNINYSIYKKYSDVIKSTAHDSECASLMTNLGIRFRENLIYPLIKEFDKEPYIAAGLLKPGKTMFIVPMANCCKTLPDYFWNFCAEIFRTIGFKVVFNVPEAQAKRFNGRNVFVPLADAVGFANLCGHVFSVRTGLLDLISTSTAQMTIFSPRGFEELDKVFCIPNDDGRIKTIFFEENDLFLEKSDPICLLYNYFTEYYFDMYKSNKYIMDILQKEHICSNDDEFISATNSFASRYLKLSNRVINQKQVYRIPVFCNVKHRFYTRNNVLMFELDYIDFSKYRLEIEFTFGNSVVATLHDHNSLMAVHAPQKAGKYKVKVTITDRASCNQQFFDTDELDFSYSVPKTTKTLGYCGGFEAYVKGLLSLSDDLIICISSRDAHTSAVPNNTVSKLHLLKAFGVQTDLVKTYRHSFLCVIDNGNVVQELSSETQKISEVCTLGDSSIEISSEGHNVNKTNKCPIEIKINGTDYAVNKRGLNFVVWDKTLGRVVDSVCFDTYTNGAASRKEET